LELTKDHLYEDLGFILAGSTRRIIMDLLNQGFLTPSMLAAESKIPLSHVSRSLKELSERELVICKTPERNKGRIYELTEYGVTVLLKLK